MTELERMIVWLDKRVPTSENAKPYIEFAMKEYAEKYHQRQLKLLGIDDVSGLACKCGNQIFTHRHSNWIECTACNMISVVLPN